MKQIKFDARFKEAILNKEKVATIRNSKKLKENKHFKVLIHKGFLRNEFISKARCKAIIQLNTYMLLKHIEYMIYRNKEHMCLSKYNLTCHNLGFASWEEALESYEKYLKKSFMDECLEREKQCYLHIFELLED